jgi:hypothetical protein
MNKKEIGRLICETKKDVKRKPRNFVELALQGVMRFLLKKIIARMK